LIETQDARFVVRPLGVNYTLWHLAVLRGLRAIGQDMRQDWILRGATGWKVVKTTMALG